MFSKLQTNIEYLCERNNISEIEVLFGINKQNINKIKKMPSNLRPIKLNKISSDENKKVTETVIAFTNATPMDILNFIKQYRIENDLKNTCRALVDYICENDIYISAIDQSISERIFNYDLKRIEIFYFEEYGDSGISLEVNSNKFIFRTSRDIQNFRLNGINKIKQQKSIPKTTDNEAMILCQKILNEQGTKLTEQQIEKMVNLTPQAINYIINQINNMLQFSLPTVKSIYNIINDAYVLFP